MRLFVRDVSSARETRQSTSLATRRLAGAVCWIAWQCSLARFPFGAGGVDATGFGWPRRQEVNKLAHYVLDEKKKWKAENAETLEKGMEK